MLDFDLYQEDRRRLPTEDVVAIMRDAIDVELEAPRRGPQGPLPVHAFHVRFRYTDSVLAMRVTEKLGSMYVDENARDRSALAESTNRFLEGQLAGMKKRLEDQDYRLKAFREQHGNELPTQVQTNMQGIQSTQLQIQALVEAIARDRDRKMVLERLYAEAEKEPVLISAAPAPVEGGTTAAAYQTAQQQLTAARAVLAGLERRLTADHPDMKIARESIADLEVKAAPEAERAAAGEVPVITSANPLELQRRESLRNMRAEIESLQRQTDFKESEEKRLRVLAHEYQRRIESVPGIESEYIALTRDYETTQGAYKDLLRQSEAAKVALDLERRQIGEQFQVLDPAGVPTRPISPLRPLISGVGLALGMLIGLGIVALLELRDSTYRSEADVLDALALPVLAMVPHIETATESKRRIRIRLLASAAGACLVSVAGYLFWTMQLWIQLL
jgi:polysaccharide chain length determinant protein (PEP-CTERM system associated)